MTIAMGIPNKLPCLAIDRPASSWKLALSPVDTLNESRTRSLS